MLSCTRAPLVLTMQPCCIIPIASAFTTSWSTCLQPFGRLVKLSFLQPVDSLCVCCPAYLLTSSSDLQAATPPYGCQGARTPLLRRSSPCSFQRLLRGIHVSPIFIAVCTHTHTHMQCAHTLTHMHCSSVTAGHGNVYTSLQHAVTASQHMQCTSSTHKQGFACNSVQEHVVCIHACLPATHCLESCCTVMSVARCIAGASRTCSPGIWMYRGRAC